MAYFLLIETRVKKSRIIHRYTTMYFDMFLSRCSISFRFQLKVCKKKPLAVGMGESQQSVQMINDKIKPFLLLKSPVSVSDPLTSPCEPMVLVG